MKIYLFCLKLISHICSWNNNFTDINETGRRKGIAGHWTGS